MRGLTYYDANRMADLQLHRCIKKGINADLCREIWKKHFGMEYPNQRTISGIRPYGE